MNKPQVQQFDYIIAGGGMSGLSLAFYLNESKLKNKTVLIIDRDKKVSNDHTWCFWEKEPGPFDEIVFHKWKSLWFHGSSEFSKLLNIDPYEYKMIRAVDFYSFVRSRLNSNNRITFLNADIQEVSDGTVTTSVGTYEANEYVFDSISIPKFDDPGNHNLLQHFLGWVIKTDEPVFSANEATLFDFRVRQERDCRFVYILPWSEHEAMVEFTVFSKSVLERSEYEAALKKYLSEVLKLEKFEVKETEFGVVPMSDEKLEENPNPKLIRIGSAGGYVKPSTGYSFGRTQNRLKSLVGALETSKTIPAEVFQRSGWKLFLDSVMLDVLENNRHAADDVFTHLFRKNSPQTMLRFLDEETAIGEDLKVMRSVPLMPFAKSALREIGRKLSG